MEGQQNAHPSTQCGNPIPLPTAGKDLRLRERIMIKISPLTTVHIMMWSCQKKNNVICCLYKYNDVLARLQYRRWRQTTALYKESSAYTSWEE